MNKRKNKTLATLLIIAVMVIAGVLIFKPGSNYRVKKGPVIAAEIGDGNRMLSKEDYKYLKEQGINTAILNINNGTDAIISLDGFNNINRSDKKLEKNDIVDRNKTALSRKKIQLFISLDCSLLNSEQMLNAVWDICRQYKPAGVVIENYNGNADDIRWTYNQAKKASNKTQIWVKTSDRSIIQVLSRTAGADGFICENLDYNGYTDLKKTVTQKILLHHSTQTMARDVFLLANLTSVDGAVVTEYDRLNRQPLFIEAAFRENENLPFFGFGVPDKFSITYPTKDFTTYYKGFFILGTGERGGVVTVNGVPYRSEKDGTFGIYYTLEKGVNTVTISQNGQSKTFTVIKKTYGTSSNSGIVYPVIPSVPQDNLPDNERGIVVQTKSNLNSLLSDPDDDSAIIRGLDPGIKLKVTGRVATTRNGEVTNAYKLSNGAYILEKNVHRTNEMEMNIKNFGTFEALNMTAYDVPTIKSGKIERLKNNDEVLTIDVNNMPAVITDINENKLTLHFLDTETIPLTDYKDLIDINDSRMFTNYYNYTEDDGTYIVLQAEETNIPWGWDVTVNENRVTVYIKNPPVIAKGDKPLENITIMLDAGHGGKDSGALGVASTNGPMEKNLNLAVAQTTKSLLEQWGATVVMTRDDDSFPSLDRRRNLIRSVKPDLFIAVHHNSMDYSYDSTKARGSECYYFSKQSENLATLLCDEITLATGRINRGANTGYYYVTRTDICPSALMEYSFIINPKDYSTTYNETDIYKAAFGTLQAVLKAIPQK